MNTHYLTSLFTPESVALFGASDRTDSVGGIVFKNLLSSGFKGRTYAINPRRADLREALKDSELPIRPIEEIQAEVETLCGGKPAGPRVTDEPVARAGSIWIFDTRP